jgi:RimJ/RimL family protein N-acetyltransferase
MEIRAIETADGPALRRFFARIPDSDRTFLKEDLDDDRVLEEWVHPDVARAIAVEGDEVIGSVAVVPLHGWSSHVGEVRLVVAPEQRGRGLGRSLAQRAVGDAVEMGLTKLVVEVIADQEALIAMFRALGFEPEALLTDHVRDRDGELRDLIVLANAVDEQLAAMATAGLTEELG